MSDTTRPKAARSSSFLFYEIETIDELNLPVVFANLNQSRKVQRGKLPSSLLPRYTESVSFQPKIVKYSLDHYVAAYGSNLSSAYPKTGPHYYKDHIYKQLGL